MSSKTPLRLLAELLAERNRQPLPSFPPGEEAKVLRLFLEKAARTRREREVARYLERAATGGGAPGTRAGSLKNLLWLLRDRAGELYEDLARALLRRVLDDPGLPLDERLAGRLVWDALFGPWAQQALAGASVDALAEAMRFERVRGWLVAFNPTALNLLAVAARKGAALYVAASEKGAVVKAIREARFPVERLPEIARRAGGAWVQPYPDQVLWPDPLRAPGLAALEAAVRAVLEGV